MGAGHAIIKCGPKGCYFNGRYYAPEEKCAVVDTTGAGDSFVAGFACEILRGSTDQDALRFANACGAICTTAVGAGTALKSREQVLRFLEDGSLS